MYLYWISADFLGGIYVRNKFMFFWGGATLTSLQSVKLVCAVTSKTAPTKVTLPIKPTLENVVN